MSLADVVREKMERGYLPTTRPTAVWTGFGSGEFCRACGDVIAPRQIRHAFDLDDRDTLSFHADCYALWDAEVRRREQRDR